jgi:DNA end-binding protein Ku
VQYKRVSTKTGREVDWDDIVKGYEYENGKYVVFTQEELNQIPVESLRVVDIVQFVEQSAIDPLYFDRSYYLAPDKTAVKAYKLFLDALAESDRVAIGKITLREKERLCTLRAKDGVLVLETMNWPDEIRVPAFEQLDQAPRISGEEKKMAQLLIDQLTGEFDPDRFQDTYRQRLQEAIDAKIEGHEVEYAPPESMPEKVVDLLDALRASVEANRARRSA